MRSVLSRTIFFYFFYCILYVTFILRLIKLILFFIKHHQLHLTLTTLHFTFKSYINISEMGITW